MASGFWDVTGDEVIVSSSMQAGSIGNRLARSEKFNFLVGPDRPLLPAVLLADPVRHSGVPRQSRPAAGGESCRSGSQAGAADVADQI